MIQQRVQVWLLPVFFSVGTVAMGNSFPDVLVQKDGSEVRGTLLEKRLMVAGPFKSSTENYSSSAPRRSPTSDQQPVRMPNLIRRNNQEQNYPQTIDQPRPSRPISQALSCTNLETDKLAVQLPLGRGVGCGSFRTTRELPKNLRLTRHLPIGGPRDGARIPKSARWARRSRRAY